MGVHSGGAERRGVGHSKGQTQREAFALERLQGPEPQARRRHQRIEAARFQTIGRGSSQPVATNETEAGRQLNRRTEIKVVLAQ